MHALLNLCRFCVLFVAGAGLFFGQLFFGEFDLLATFTGVFGLTAAIPGMGRFSLTPMLAAAVVISSLLTLTGVGLDAYDYYASRDPHTGTYFPWILFGPYCVAILVIAVHAARQLK